MKIPQQLPQFKEEQTLLIISSKQSAELYLAHKGSLRLVREIEVKNQKYSDREGFFTRSGHGSRLGSGSVYEDKELAVKTDFLNRLEKGLDSILKKHTSLENIYLFAPQAHAKSIQKSLPDKVRSKIQEVYAGNYVNLPPLEVLRKISAKKIAKEKTASRTSAPKEAKKVLRKSKKARRVVGKQDHGPSK